MSAIEIIGLTKDYHVGFWRKRPWRALDSLTLHVERGEVFGFLGHNGAGKTTTLKILNGIIFPTAGSATILGKPVGQPETFLSLGYLPENPYFYDYLTATELLDYFAQFYPMTASERIRRRDTVLDQVSLSNFRKWPLRKFSKGMLQRLGIAQAILHEPEIVLLDEPMSGLDPMGRREVRNLITQLKAAGKTVFFSTHILSDAEALCDRVAILSRGKLVGVGQVSELLKQRAGFEVVLECSKVTPELRFALETIAINPVIVSGSQIRLEIAEQSVPKLLSLCDHELLRLVSLNPIHVSLEDYYAELLQNADTRFDSAGKTSVAL